MSTDGSDPRASQPQTPQTPAEAVRTAQQEARFGAAFFRVYGPRLLLVFLGVLLPLWGFGALVEDLQEGKPFAFDVPLLQFLHAQAGPTLDRFALLATRIGYAWGVMPFDVLFVAVMAWRRHFREGLFAGIALFGSALLNVGAKHSFERARPDLWISIAPERTYSFPSGHAMGSMTLALTLVLLCWSARTRWGTRWRGPVAAIGAAFVLWVGWARVYLGVHYPSDVIAGMVIGLAWAGFCMATLEASLVLARRRSPREVADELPAPTEAA